MTTLGLRGWLSCLGGSLLSQVGVRHCACTGARLCLVADARLAIVSSSSLPPPQATRKFSHSHSTPPRLDDDTQLAFYVEGGEGNTLGGEAGHGHCCLPLWREGGREGRREGEREG